MVPSYPWYWASSDGEIYGPSGKMVKQHFNKSTGYMQIRCSINGKTTNGVVHRMVAEAFYGSANGRYVDHINSNRTDNRVCNLEYVTPKENSQRILKPIRWKAGEQPWVTLNTSDTASTSKIP